MHGVYDTGSDSSAGFRGKLESTSIPQSVRQRVEDAVEKLGGRVTVGDVAARAGVPLEVTERALNALAADCEGVLQVNSIGCSPTFSQPFSGSQCNASQDSL